ncbi:hypothetical protein BH23VER1_BH23VER1_20830 [soil metagenome]
MFYSGMHTTVKAKRATQGRGRLTKVRGIENLYRYSTTGIFYACYFRAGKTVKRSLKTTDRLTAKQALAEVIRDAAHVDHALGRTTTLEKLVALHMEVRVSMRDENTQKKLAYIRDVLVSTWPQSMAAKVGDVRRSDVERWIAYHCNRTGHIGQKLSKGTINEYIQFVRAVFQTGIDERIIARSPVEGIKNMRRDRPIRRTPTVSEFRRIVADLRGQVFNAGAKETADFVEFIGLSGLGNAEVAALRWGHVRFRRDGVGRVDWLNSRIHVQRKKTERGFVIPVFPQLAPLMEELHGLATPDPSVGILQIANARRALTSCCERLGLPRYGHRALRRMFIENCIHRGIDVQTIALWQGHNDNGQLILSTYAHVRQEFADGQAAKLTALPI